ncbi:MAG TPA: SDR family NAD(P)-dependent oxidoreductase [Acidimicrobiales bacterium]|nr:SDR family NAD(P)-dependent oxidoreductase [Acidimicrobiales bacterium]
MTDPFAAYDMTGRVAVLTGGASGIGEASAELIAAAGGAVVLGDIDEGGAEKVAQRIRDDGGRAVAQRCNVAQKSDVDALVDRSVSEFGRVDAMGNIAGVMNADLVINITEAEFDRIVAINMKGVLWGCQAALRVMMPQGSGSIINISSAAIDYPNSNVSLYAMTKAAVAMLTMELAIEAGPHGVRVNCLAPGQTATNFGRYLREDDKGDIDPEKYAGYVSRGTSLSPIGRLGEAIDQAHLVHYLASDASRFATGAIFRVNGGVGIVW